MLRAAGEKSICFSLWNSTLGEFSYISMTKVRHIWGSIRIIFPITKNIISWKELGMSIVTVKITQVFVFLELSLNLQDQIKLKLRCDIEVHPALISPKPVPTYASSHTCHFYRMNYLLCVHTLFICPSPCLGLPCKQCLSPPSICPNVTYPWRQAQIVATSPGWKKFLASLIF